MITIKNLTVGYERHPAVHHLSGSFAAGSLTAVVGPNGGGKSTLLKALAGFLRPMSGLIDFNGINPRQIAYLPQQSEVDRSFPLSVKDIVALGHWPEIGAFRGLNDKQKARDAYALQQVGMLPFADRPIGVLSTGQWQRVLFARLIVQDAPVILLDEPFAAIDNRSLHDLMHIVEHWHQEGRIVIAVMHDLALVREHFAEALLLAREAVAWGPPAETLKDENLAHARALADHWTEHAAACRDEERVSS